MLYYADLSMIVHFFTFIIKLCQTTLQNSLILSGYIIAYREQRIGATTLEIVTLFFYFVDLIIMKAD